MAAADHAPHLCETLNDPFAQIGGGTAHMQTVLGEWNCDVGEVVHHHHLKVVQICRRLLFDFGGDAWVM